LRILGNILFKKLYKSVVQNSIKITNKKINK